MNVCIIGYRGYIGSFLYESFTNTTGFASSVKGFNKNERIDDIDKYDIVLYFIGLNGRLQSSHKTDEELFDQNVHNIVHVANQMKENSLLVYASTSAVYEGYGGRSPPTEKDILYVHLFDKYTKYMHLREQNIQKIPNKIHTIGLRMGTVVGIAPYQRTDLLHMAMINKAMGNNTIHVHSADKYRPVLWNRDLLRVVNNLIREKDTIVGHHVINVCSFNDTIGNIANTIAARFHYEVVHDEKTTGNDEAAATGFSMDTSRVQQWLDVTFVGTNELIIDDLQANISKLRSMNHSFAENYCRVCKTNKLLDIFDFGNHPNANHYSKTRTQCLPEYPLKLQKCVMCHHLQINFTIAPTLLFSDYIYLTGTSNTMRAYCETFAQMVVRDTAAASPTATVLDIACNDGSLLDEFRKKGWKTYGYDPARNLHDISSRKGHDVTVGFWGVDPTPNYPKLDAIVAQNVLAHVPDPVLFLRKCKTIMDTTTILYVQTSQCNMIEDGQFDTIYHDHLSFFNIHSMTHAVNSAGLYIDSIEKIPIHGISYLFKIKLYSDTKVMDHLLYIYENHLGLYDSPFYDTYVDKIVAFKTWLLEELDKFKKANIPLIGYGAAAKGMTILNYVGQIDMEYIIDESPYKQNLYATKYGYPIKPLDILDQSKTEEGTAVAILILAWNFVEEITHKIIQQRPNTNTYLIVPYPQQHVYHINEHNKCQLRALGF